MIISVDFDSTLVKTAWPKVGKSIPYAFSTLRKLQNAGHKIVLLTMREHCSVGDVPDILQIAIDKVKSEGIELFGINELPDDERGEYHPSRKVYSDLIIDDHCAGIWLRKDEVTNESYVDWRKLSIWLRDQGYFKKIKGD